MIKQFIKDSLIYLIPTLFSRGIGIFLLPIYTRIVSPQDMGALDLFLIFGNLVAILIAMEVTQGIARHIPEITNKSLRIEYNSSGLWFTIMIYSLFTIFAFNFKYEVNDFLTGNIHYVSFYQVFLGQIFLNGVFYYLQTLLRFEGKSLEYSVISVIYATSNLLMVLLFGLLYKFGMLAIIYSMILSSVISILASFFVLRQSIGFTFKFPLLLNLLKFSLPLVPASMLIFLSLYIDRYMIKIFLDLENVGIYSIGIRIASISSIVMVGFQMAITPLVYKHYHEPDTPKNLAKIFNLFVVFACLFFVALSFFSKEILTLLTTKDYLLALNLIPLLVLAYLFSNAYVFLPGIAIKKKTNIMLVIGLIAASLNLILNYLLIPLFGIIGAAQGTLIGYFASFLGYIYFSQKYYYISFNWLKVSFLFVVAIMSVFLFFSFSYNISLLVSLLLRLGLLIMIIIVIYKLELISLKDFLFIKQV